jgi:hypothetical protein
MGVRSGSVSVRPLANWTAVGFSEVRKALNIAVRLRRRRMAAKMPREKPRMEPMVVWVERREAADWRAVRSEAWRLWRAVSI